VGSVERSASIAVSSTALIRLPNGFGAAALAPECLFGLGRNWA
jgi:hypothetical protein